MFGLVLSMGLYALPIARADAGEDAAYAACRRLGEADAQYQCMSSARSARFIDVEAVALCDKISTATRTAECIADIVNRKFQDDAAAACLRLKDDELLGLCVKVIAGHEFTSDVVSACDAVASQGSTVECFLQSVEHRKGRGVYCAPLMSTHSLYSIRDQRSLGRATFGEREECDRAAEAANEARNGLFCAAIRTSDGYGYSVYRLDDAESLGTYVYGGLDSCLTALAAATRSKVCLPVGTATYSVFRVRTGEDIGRDVFPSLDACIEDGIR